MIATMPKKTHIRSTSGRTSVRNISDNSDSTKLKDRKLGPISGLKIPLPRLTSQNYAEASYTNVGFTCRSHKIIIIKHVKMTMTLLKINNIPELCPITAS